MMRSNTRFEPIKGDAPRRRCRHEPRNHFLAAHDVELGAGFRADPLLIIAAFIGIVI